MRCVGCNLKFSQSDIDVTEEGELPICDECASKHYHFQMFYDGKMDLFKYVEMRLPENLCVECYNGNLQLINMQFLRKFKVETFCDNCGDLNKASIYLVYT